MPLSFAELNDRFRAAILGFAVGDALGFPLRGAPPSTLWRTAGLADDFAPRPRGHFAKGQFSDDTQLMLAAAHSVARERRVDGRSAALHLASLWHEGIVVQPPPALTAAIDRLSAGVPWMSAGASIGQRDPSALSRGVVVGLWSCRRPERIAHEASVLTVITHKDPACAAATAALARAVSLGLSGVPLTAPSFCEELAAVASRCDPWLADEVRHLPRALAWDVPRALELLRRIGVPPAALEAAPGLPPHLAPVLLSALYAALKAPHDFRAALELVLRCGGEVDVAAAACGAVMGAQLGTGAIPPRLRKSILYAEQLLETADRLFEARRLEDAIALVTRKANR